MGQAWCVLVQELHAVSSDQLGSFEEAEQDPCWRRAMLKKMRAIEDNGTWCLEDLSARRRDEYDNIVKHKARLVVKGYA
jgi:hypothetical protein